MQVIIALSKRNAKHVPYRSSKLTHFLKDSIGGNCQTLLVSCIWSDVSQQLAAMLMQCETIALATQRTTHPQKACDVDTCPAACAASLGHLPEVCSQVCKDIILKGCAIFMQLWSCHLPKSAVSLEQYFPFTWLSLTLVQLKAHVSNSMLSYCLQECQLSETLSTCRFAQRMMQVRVWQAAHTLLKMFMPWPAARALLKLSMH